MLALCWAIYLLRQMRERCIIMQMREYDNIKKLLDNIGERDNYALGCWLGSQATLNKCQYIEDLAVLIVHYSNGDLLVVEADDKTEEYATFQEQDRLLEKWGKLSAEKAVSRAEDFISAQNNYLKDWSDYWDRVAREEYDDLMAWQNSEYWSAVL